MHNSDTQDGQSIFSAFRLQDENYFILKRRNPEDTLNFNTVYPDINLGFQCQQ